MYLDCISIIFRYQIADNKYVNRLARVRLNFGRYFIFGEGVCNEFLVPKLKQLKYLGYLNDIDERLMLWYVCLFNDFLDRVLT